MDRAYPTINNILEQAACIVKRGKEATGEIEPTEGYKRGQIKELTDFAHTNNLWIDLSHLDITYMDKGGENEVFDAVPNNVLYGIDGDLYFIDTQIRLRASMHI